MYKPVLFGCMFLFLNITTKAQTKILPDEAKPFLLPGYEMLDYIAGDLNNDKKEDAVLVLKQNMEDSSYDEPVRPLLILIRQPDGKLQQLKRNDSAIMCYHCGGVFGDPYEGIEITKTGFEIRFYGGSSWRWGYTYTFTYNALKKNWYLTRQHEVNYHNTDIENTEKELNIEKAELGEVDIDSFNGNPGFTQTKWKVTAAKTFFYNNPKIGSKSRKGYLLKGDVISSYRQTKNFVQVYFENKKAQSSSGFVLKKDLVKTE